MDALRGAAIVMMAAYHFIFDVWYLDIAKFDMFSLPLVLFQRAIGISFLLLVGVSLTLSESRNRAGFVRHLRRGLFLGAVALAITAATWIYPHEGFITFGIVHLIALATLAAPAFFGLARLNVLLGLLIIVAGLLAADVEVQSPFLFWLGLTQPGYAALDFYPVLPWFGVVLIGVFAGQTLYPDGKGRFKVPDSGLIRTLGWAGRNSLSIYLVHQPLIFGTLLLIRALAGI